MSKRRLRSRKGAPGVVDVAKRAGVSPATVSRFYNAPEVVKPPTRKRIEAAASELGYIRDRIASAMQNRFSGTFGLIVPTIDNAIFAEMIEAFSAELQKHDRTMLIAAHGYNLELESAIVRSLLERRIDGLAMIGFDHDAVSMNMLEQRDVSVISIWNYREKDILPSIGANNHEAGFLVTNHLLELGHENFTLIFPEIQNNDRARARYDGVKDALSQAKGHPLIKQEFTCAYDVGRAKQLAIEIFSKENHKDNQCAIICGNDVIAHGVIHAANKMGIKIPQELSVVGIGDFGGSEHLEPSLTTVRLPAKRIGIQAAQTLLAMSENGIIPKPFNQAIPLSIQIRNSTAAPRDE